MTETTMDAATIPAGTVFAVDRETRTIRGLAVPYGVPGIKGGKRFQFSRGTIRPREGMTVKGWALHDQNLAWGAVTEWDDTDEGLVVAIKAAATPEGDRALANADAANGGPWDGMSIGPSEGAKYVLRDGTYHAVDIPIHEISLTPAPVFGAARVTSVAFDTNPNQEGHQPMTDTATPPAAPTAPAVEVPADFSALAGSLTDAVTTAIADGFASMTNPQGGREVIVAGHAPVEVGEPIPYRFDGPGGEFSLIEDLRSAQQGDGSARQRFETFVEEAFAVTTGNVSALNPNRNRPDLYVPNLTYSTPLWDSVSTGTIEDKTPFTIPKFLSSGGLVAPHVEGVEPTPGSFAATSQTVSPTPLSGKVEILREVIDQGGSPQADAIVWGEMLNAWYEAREQRIAATLAAVPTAELNLGSAVDGALVAALTNYFAGLQFVRGGNRFVRFAADGALFPALVGAKDSAGRPLLPVLAPANAQGQTGAGFDSVALGNQSIKAAWALGASNASKSYSFVPSSVWAWSSTPKRFTFEYQVKSVDMAIWGYAAGAVLRDSDVKPIDYTVADA